MKTLKHFSLISCGVLSSKKDMKELKLTEQEVCNSITIKDNQTGNLFEAFYNAKDALEAAKNKFLETNEAEDVEQCNAQRFSVKKDDELFAFDYIEFTENEGTWQNGTTYASNEEAQKIFNNETKVDFTYVSDYATCFDYETCEEIEF